MAIARKLNITSLTVMESMTVKMEVMKLTAVSVIMQLYIINFKEFCIGSSKVKSLL